MEGLTNTNKDYGQKESAFYDVIVEHGTSNHVLRGHGRVNTGPDFGQEWEDYSLQVRIMFVKGEEGCHFVVRHWYKNEENNWGYAICINQDETRICKMVNGVHNEVTRGDKNLGYNT